MMLLVKVISQTKITTKKEEKEIFAIFVRHNHDYLQ